MCSKNSHVTFQQQIMWLNNWLMWLDRQRTWPTYSPQCINNAWARVIERFGIITSQNFLTRFPSQISGMRLRVQDNMRFVIARLPWLQQLPFVLILCAQFPWKCHYFLLGTVEMVLYSLTFYVILQFFRINWFCNLDWSMASVESSVWF